MAMTRQEIFKKCIDKWGAHAQVMVAAEECIELALALHHLTREKKAVTLRHVTEEVADVELMIEQLKYMLELSPVLIHNDKEKKLRRVRRMLREKP